ncbi:MAG: uroporphyrinogen decarboxylase [Verrucomicrobiota bacterium]
MTSRERMNAALRQQAVDRPPVWIMRQAGRYLPEYRELKEKYRFTELVESPELACEVTLQPLQRFPLDAAITFSDILVVPKAMGVHYHFSNGKGISMEKTVTNRADVDALDLDGAIGQLEYVYATQQLIRESVGNDQAVLGFSGTPWTLAAYMVEGGGSEYYDKIKRMALEAPDVLEALLEKLSGVVADYLIAQADAGVDGVQLFDSAAPGIPGNRYEQWSLRYVRQVIEKVGGIVPVIYFVRGMGSHLELQAGLGADVLSLDWTHALPDAVKTLNGRAGVQGNFDPVLLCQPPEIVRSQVQAGLEAMRGTDGYIVNLGHGILPHARIDAVEAMVDTVVRFT